MKRAIVVQADYRLMSALVDIETAQTLKEGERIKVAQDLELEGLTLPRGEFGRVVKVDGGPCGFVEIEFDNPIPALHEWRNVLLLVPFDTDDLISGLALETCFEAKEIAPQRAVVRSPAGRALRLAAAVVIAFMVGWCVELPAFMAHALDAKALLETVRLLDGWGG